MRGFVVASAMGRDIGNGTFERMSFVGGPACGNFTNTGANANTIIKDSAFYGEGGRYLFVAYQTSNIQIINAIFRVDGGWGNTVSCAEAEPNAALNFYDSSSAVCDGCINIDERVTAVSLEPTPGNPAGTPGGSETLGGLGINAHTRNGGNSVLCFNVEIKNSVSYNAAGFWAGGNGVCNTKFTNIKGDFNFNLDGTATVTDSTSAVCNEWKNFGAGVTSNNNIMASGNCKDTTGAGVALNLKTTFLNDPRWRAEMCNSPLSNRTDGWCATNMSLSDYVSQ